MGGGGGGWGIFESQEFFLVIKFLAWTFFRPSNKYFLGLIGVHEFFSFNFPLREYFFGTLRALRLTPSPPAPISFPMVRPLLERGDLRITICQLRIDDGIYNVARVQTLIGCRLFIVLKFVKIFWDAMPLSFPGRFAIVGLHSQCVLWRALMYYHVRFSWMKRVIMNKWPNFVKYSQALV